MKASELRQKYLDFFKNQGHEIIPSASLIPENDPTVLFTTAGMHPLVPFLLGEKHPAGTRLVNVQKCVRTGDIDEVGDRSHNTFFEMLGNWSLGDYFKREAIEMSWEFLTSPKYLGLDQQKIAVSVFRGDDDAPQDEEAAEVWLSLGIPPHKIAYLPKENNWWGPAGQTGPCGPDTEMFYWIGPSDLPPDDSDPGNDEANWLEIWNDVFLQYQKEADGSFRPLEQRNIDTGMGLERTLMTLNGLEDVFQTDVLWPLVEKIQELSGKKYNESEEVKKAMRIIVDHIRTATMILGDNKGVAPSNLGQGYVLRRSIRRAVRYGKMIGINGIFTSKLAAVAADIYEAVYPEIKKNKKFIIDQLALEEEKFIQTLERGLKKMEKLIKEKMKPEHQEAVRITEHGKVAGSAIGSNVISGKEAFDLYQTYGFPPEMIREELENLGMKLDDGIGYTFDDEEFQEEFQKHQELSRTASAGMFKGGLADASAETTRLHTAAHLMLESLRRVLGETVQQKGSNITAERLRFDFSYDRKMTPEEIKRVEDLVNEHIAKQLPVHFEEMTVEEAKKLGATGVFEHKYGDKVKVYFIGNEGDPASPDASRGGYFSREICGGPHVENISELGHFKITKEESSSAGVRRIKAVLE